MATNFPASLDALNNPSSADTLDNTTTPHAAQHANANDAVEALQAKVGVDGSGVTSSLDYLVKSAEAPGHTHDAAYEAKGDIGLLAYVAYNPGTVVTYSTTSATAVDVDATNLAVTFTVPSSGRVLVRLNALTDSSGGSGFWSLREGSSVVAGAQGRVTNADATPRRLSHATVIPGLTAGASLTWKWAYLTSGGTPRVFAGGDIGPAVMEVHAA